MEKGRKALQGRRVCELLVENEEEQWAGEILGDESPLLRQEGWIWVQNEKSLFWGNFQEK